MNGSEDPSNEVLLSRLRETLEEATKNPSHSLATMTAASYRSLLRVAHAQRGAHAKCPTLSTTTLVHETYLKLHRSADLQVADTGHFHSLAARAMRFVLTDRAREKLAQKRGGDAVFEPIDDHLDLGTDAHHAEQVVELDDALERLEQVFPRMAQVVSLRFYAGLSDAEIGAALGIDERTVRRDWIKARGWMLGQLRNDRPASH